MWIFLTSQMRKLLRYFSANFFKCFLEYPSLGKPEMCWLDKPHFAQFLWKFCWASNLLCSNNIWCPASHWSVIFHNLSQHMWLKWNSCNSYVAPFCECFVRAASNLRRADCLWVDQSPKSPVWNLGTLGTSPWHWTKFLQVLTAHWWWHSSMSAKCALPPATVTGWAGL